METDGADTSSLLVRATDWIVNEGDIPAVCFSQVPKIEETVLGNGIETHGSNRKNNVSSNQ